MEYAEMMEIEMSMVLCAYDFETERIFGEESDGRGLKNRLDGKPWCPENRQGKDWSQIGQLDN